MKFNHFADIIFIEKRDNMNNFCTRLKLVRSLRGISRKDLGTRVGLSNPAARIGNYENGAAIPKTFLLNKIAKELGVTSNWLKTGKQDMTTLNNLKDTSFFYEGENLKQAEYFYQLKQLLEYNEPLLTTCLSHEDLKSISDTIYNAVIRERGSKRELLPFMPKEQYDEMIDYIQENQEYEELLYDEYQQELFNEEVESGRIIDHCEDYSYNPE